MRVGQSPFSAHQAGMSALWHDADYVPEQRFETPIVMRGLQDFAVPSEQHQLPDGVEDPFQKLEAIFELAAAQMDRGIRGVTFLHGKPPVEVAGPHERHEDATHAALHAPGKPSAVDVANQGEAAAPGDWDVTLPHRKPPEPAAPYEHHEDATQAMRHAPAKGSALDDRIMRSVRADLEQARRTDQAAARPTATTNTGAGSAAEREAKANAPQTSAALGDGPGAAAVIVPMAIGQGLQSAVQGPIPALASQAIVTMGAATSAAQLTAVGIAEGMNEDAPVVPRRGLRDAKKS